MKWLGVALLFSGPGALVLLEAVAQEEPEMQHAGEGDAEERTWVKHNEKGEVVLILDEATQTRIGLVVEPLEESDQPQQIVAYGRLEPDPGLCCSVRAPLDGFLQSPAGGRWPSIGDVLTDQTVVGAIEPRFTALERFELRSRRVDAAAQVDALTAGVEAARASFDNKRRLHAEGNVSDRALEEAEAKLKIDEAQLSAAAGKLRLLDKQLSETNSSIDTVPMRMPQGGEVVGVHSRPGEAVTSGQELLRVIRFDRQIARVEIPVGECMTGPISSSRILVLGYENHPLAGELLGSPQILSNPTQGQNWLLSVAVGDLPVRPGAAVIAYLERQGETLKGVIVPRSAILRYAGLEWIYLQVTDHEFVRCRVTLHSPLENGWFSLSDVGVGNRVVVVAAQMLLSEELRAQIDREAEAKE